MKTTTTGRIARSTIVACGSAAFDRPAPSLTVHFEYMLYSCWYRRASGKRQAYEPAPVVFTIGVALRIIEADRYGF